MSYQNVDLEGSEPLPDKKMSSFFSAGVKYTLACGSMAAAVLFLYSTTSVTVSKGAIKANLAANGYLSYSALEEDSRQYLFKHFKAKYNRVYRDDAEEAEKYENFQKFLDIVDDNNNKEIIASGTAIHGITKFADWTEEERKKLLGYVPQSTINHSNKENNIAKKLYNIDTKTDTTTDKATTTSSDWSGIYTTAVKDQGYCGSCWAFSATEQMESDSIRAGLLTVDDALSPQQIVSCDSYDYGCGGGNTETAYFYTYEAGGIETDEDYPYTSYWDVTGTCSFDASKAVVTITDYFEFSQTDKESTMMDYVLTTGPLSVCLDASNWATYVSGILSTCGTEVDHCVQIVGVDVEKNVWKVRNSWGTDWGLDGYILLKAGENMCDITYDPSFTTMKTV